MSDSRMTNYLSRLRERATHMQRPEEFMRKPTVFEFNDQKTGDVRRHTLDRNEEYELTLTVGVRYWCNDAQRVDARRNAEAVLARTLYEDVLRALSEIRHAVFDGDQRAALGRISELEKELTR
jgi:hypothetical protein